LSQETESRLMPIREREDIESRLMPLGDAEEKREERNDTRLVYLLEREERNDTSVIPIRDQELFIIFAEMRW